MYGHVNKSINWQDYRYERTIRDNFFKEIAQQINKQAKINKQATQNKTRQHTNKKCRTM